MTELIEAIKDRLAEVVTDLKYIDEDWGQLDYYSPNQPVKWPCVLIDLNQVVWTNQGKLDQLGIAQVSIRIATIKLSNTNQRAPDTQREAAAGIFTLLKDIHAALHGWADEDAMNGPLTRTLTRKVKRDDGIREFEMIYSAQVSDDSATPKTEAFPTTAPMIKVKVEKL